MKRNLFFLSFIVLLSYGCASGPSASSMVANIKTQTKVTANGALIITDVTGGKDTNPMWVTTVDNVSFREALYKSLKYAGLFQNTLLNGNSDYRLETEIISQEVKSGINMSATILIRYELYKQGDDEAMWAENIFSQHEAFFEETFYGVKRAQLAVEGAVKENIKQLILKLRAYIGSSNL